MRTVAVLVSLVVPGGGHALLGRPLRGAVWMALFWLSQVSGVLIGPIGQAIGALALLGATIDAGLVEARPHRQAELLLVYVAVMVVMVVLVRRSLIEAFTIPSSGMLPSLEVGDHIMVAKWDVAPRRGEVAVFDYPLDPQKSFAQRIVGLAGDRVEVRGGVLLVNGKPATDGDPVACEVDDGSEIEGWHRLAAQCAPEKLDAKRYTVAHIPGAGPHDMPETTVPPGQVFVLDDNRENSADSRFWGPVPNENIKGRVMYIWWSSGPGGARWSRVGRRL